MSTALVKYESACKALAEAKTSFEALAIRNDATVLKAAAKAAKNPQLRIDAEEIEILAERRLGELIRAQKETVGLNRGTLRRGSRKEPRDNKPTLAEAGIDKKLSSRAQKLASIPDVVFEKQRIQWRTAAEQKPTKRTAFAIAAINARRGGADESVELVAMKHRDFDISHLDPWSLPEARHLLGRFLRTCYRDWWKSDKHKLIELLRREIEWMEIQENE